MEYKSCIIADISITPDAVKKMGAKSATFLKCKIINAAINTPVKELSMEDLYNICLSQ
jgi:hypothetical protein